jgi:MFS family permease
MMRRKLDDMLDFSLLRLVLPNSSLVRLATTRLRVGLPWGRLSDFYGRKPMIVCGLLGTVTATSVFGFSTSFTQAILARTGAGLLNGNVGVIRTMVAEMVVERAHQAKAFSVMPVVWSLGSILGPILGGA